MSYGIFTPDMKQTHTVLVPGMLDIHFRLFPAIFETAGYHVEVLYNEGEEVVEEGLSHVHNDTCYPALLVIGQMIEALKSGKYDLNKVALAITQTGGGCRASNYIFLLRKALEHEGWEHIPVLSVNFSGLEKENSVELTLPLGKKLLYAFLYGDAIMWLKNQVKPYELHKGETDRLVRTLIQELSEKFANNRYDNAKQFYKDLIDRFKAIPRSDKKKIRVGIVGEIYMKYAPLGNHHLEDFLIEEGFEPVLSGVADFGLYCLENAQVDHRYYHRHALTFPFLSLAENILIRMQETFTKLVEEDGTFHAPDRFKQVIKNADGFIDQGVKMGEGWLLTAEVVSLIKEGISNIISAQPFGCLPNHIVAKGMAKKIKDVYPQSNLVAIDYDPSASRVNQENRIRLMLANAKLSMEELKDAKDTAYSCMKTENQYA